MTVRRAAPPGPARTILDRGVYPGALPGAPGVSDSHPAPGVPVS